MQSPLPICAPRSPYLLDLRIGAVGRFWPFPNSGVPNDTPIHLGNGQTSFATIEGNLSGYRLLFGYLMGEESGLAVWHWEQQAQIP